MFLQNIISFPLLCYLFIYINVNVLFCRNKKVNNHTNVMENVSTMETLLMRLQKLEEENRKILKDKELLEQQNKQFSIEITKLQKEVTQLQTEVATDRQKQTDAISVKVLKEVFTPGQITKLMSPTNSRIQWSPADIVSAIGLRALSPKAYRYVRNVKKIPLPCPTTLHNWVAKFNVLPGILSDVLKIMSSKENDLSVTKKLTILTFDELYVCNKLDMERKQQKIYGPHKTCQFIMARGLFSNWRQPVFHNFDTAMSREILFNVIQQLYNIDYIVIVVTCDMSSTNMKLWRELQIGADNDSVKK